MYVRLFHAYTQWQSAHTHIHLDYGNRVSGSHLFQTICLQTEPKRTCDRETHEKKVTKPKRPKKNLRNKTVKSCDKFLNNSIEAATAVGIAVIEEKEKYSRI